MFEVGLKEALFSPKYMKAKRCLLTNHPNPKTYEGCPCIKCGYRIIREGNNTIIEL